MSQKYDVAIIGGGIMGCATAYALARRGSHVLLLEQFKIGHPYGSSHGPSRFFRLAYGSTIYLQLAQAALSYWHMIEEDAGMTLLSQVGGLDLGIPGTSAFDAVLHTLLHANIRYEFLDPAELRRRFPQFTASPETACIFQPDAGILNADACISTLSHLSRRYKAVIYDNTVVQRILPDGNGCTIFSPQGQFQVDCAIICAGPWMRTLLDATGVVLPLAIKREQVAYFEVRDPNMFSPVLLPPFIHHIGRPNTYGFPLFGSSGIKLAYHNGGSYIDVPDAEDVIDVSSLKALRVYASNLFSNQLTGKIMLATNCRYTMTPDEGFLIDRHPIYPQILYASPCSGHGFKFASIIGQILADLAIYGQSRYALDAFALARFQ